MTDGVAAGVESARTSQRERYVISNDLAPPDYPLGSTLPLKS